MPSHFNKITILKIRRDMKFFKTGAELLHEDSRMKSTESFSYPLL